MSTPAMAAPVPATVRDAAEIFTLGEAHVFLKVTPVGAAFCGVAEMLVSLAVGKQEGKKPRARE